MDIPFTVEQFFEVMRQYNETVWPTQIFLNVLALIAMGLIFVSRPYSGRVISAILAFMWAWTGIAYHLVFFTSINNAAYGFSFIYLLGALAFVWAGVVKGKLEYYSSNVIYRFIGGVLIIYSLFVYPVLSSYFGHSYPYMPTFGLPCPTTIFTIGMLCLVVPPLPRYVMVAPIIWSIVGSQAAFLFGVYQDLGRVITKSGV